MGLYLIFWFQGSPEKAGKWNDVGCSEKRGYVCEIKAEEQYPEQESSYWEKCEVNQALSENGFVSKPVAGETHSCYYPVDVPKSFSEAEEHCKNLGADLFRNVHLLSVHDWIEEDMMIFLTFDQSQDDMWLGLKKEEVRFQL